MRALIRIVLTPRAARIRLTKVLRGIAGMFKFFSYQRFSPVTAGASIVFFFAALSCAAPFAPAQIPIVPKAPENQAPAAQKPADAQRPEGQTSEETLKVSVNVVGLFFNVKDKHGALVPNLIKDDFTVLEDGKAQTIKYFAAESNLPLTLGILIDSSGSQARVLDMEKQVGGDFLSQLLREQDLGFVIDFDVNV